MIEQKYIDMKTARQIEIENDIWKAKIDSLKTFGPEKKYVDMTSLVQLKELRGVNKI